MLGCRAASEALSLQYRASSEPVRMVVVFVVWFIANITINIYVRWHCHSVLLCHSAPPPSDICTWHATLAEQVCALKDGIPFSVDTHVQ